MKLRDRLLPANSSDLLIHVGIASQLFRTSLAQIVSNTVQYGMRAEIFRFQSSDVQLTVMLGNFYEASVFVAS